MNSFEGHAKKQNIVERKKRIIVNRKRTVGANKCTDSIVALEEKK
jgi:hypothetical protein